MSTVLHTQSVEHTQQVGERIAAVLQGGEILLLQGDLGVGKTQLTKGIARGLAVAAEVVSPTFTLVAQYEGRLPLSHYDLYRIENTEDLREIGYLEEDDRRAVRVVEWGERAALPPDAIEIRMTMEGDEARRIEIVGLSLPEEEVAGG